MRAWPLVVLIGILFAASTVLTAIGGLSRISSEQDVALLEQIGLTQGHAAQLFATSFVWSRYPMLPSLSMLVDTKSVLLTVPLIAAIILFSHLRVRCGFPFRITACLATMVVPYATGAIVLRDNVIPEQSGPWLVVMFLGPLYAMVASGILCVVELARSSRQRVTSC